MIDPHTPKNPLPIGLSDLDYNLVFSDEFMGENLDTKKWTARNQYRGIGNSNVEWWYKPENVRMAGGGNNALAIDVGKLSENVYSGGRIDSQGKFDFVYGVFESRIHVPKTEGHLAAVWLQAADGLPEYQDVTARTGAEFDILESNTNKDQYAITLHWGGYGKYHQQSSVNVLAPKLRQVWYHTFGVIWEPNKIIFIYDGKAIRTITDPNLISQVKEFPILSNEVIKFAEGDIRTCSLDQSATVYIDYVRIWQKKI